MQQEAVKTAEAPQPIGPYNQAVKLGQFVFCSGTVGVDPAAGKMVSEEVQAQTRQVLLNLGAVLGAAGSSLGQVLKTTVFLTDMADFAAMNGVYAEFFNGTAPARSTVQVVKLPGGAKVEIEAIAFIP
ncbi:MAG: Rid family detoxifying hydrolase [Chloroflexi bacterium]|nr:Rid family detoxifying hydrolase [Chloroflexota bacterium]MCL5111229.1 Rid family detoxifying hydrolase [Chloroflexota bacterium]